MNVVRKRCPGDPMEIGVGSFVAGCLRQVNSLAQAPEYDVGWCHRNNLSFDSRQVLSSALRGRCRGKGGVAYVGGQAMGRNRSGPNPY